MGYNLTDEYLNLLDDIGDMTCVANTDLTKKLASYIKSIYRSDLQNKYAEPMLWIGTYIVFASLLCIFAMAADLLHGLQNRKFWIPCKYFSINATSLLLISIAMKLPVDLSGPMPGDVDQAAKLGSLAFMCTMMANLLLSLAAMDSKDLLSNITALGILVITLVVNVCIQINTGVVSIKEKAKLEEFISSADLKSLGVGNKDRNSIFAGIYVGVLLVLLIIYVCSSLAILKSKQIIESKYKQRHEKITSKQSPPPGELLTVDKLEEHMRNYWIMAGSGSPQFIIACSVTTTASGIICVVPTVLHTLTMCWTIKPILERDCDSDYQWSTEVILIVQFIGVIVGTVAPFSRCFATLSFKVSFKSIRNVFEVENYWSSKLFEWKHASLPFPLRGEKLETVIHYSTNVIISVCIQLQAWIVVMCKTIALIPFFIMICVLHCFRCFKKSVQDNDLRQTEISVQDNDLRQTEISVQDNDLRQTEISVQDNDLRQAEKSVQDRDLRQAEKSVQDRDLRQAEKSVQEKDLLQTEKSVQDKDKDLRQYVLQLEDEKELLTERTLKGLLKSMKGLIQKGEEGYPENLTKLIVDKSRRDFPGVKDIKDRHSLEKKYQDCWSLPVVTLTTIALSLPDIGKEQVDSLLKSVREGLNYITLVEESLLINATDTDNDYASVQKAANSLWKEVKFYRKWLEIKLKKLPASSASDQVDKTRHVIEWFKSTARKMGTPQARKMETPQATESTAICANSMYHITKTILLSYQANTDDKVSQEQLFEKLLEMIADITAACLTNLPQVIAMKCHTSEIEKREASVRAAAKLLGKTKEIIKVVQERQPSCMNANDLPFLEKWHASLDV